jgi:hypothetical protein
MKVPHYFSYVKHILLQTDYLIKIFRDRWNTFVIASKRITESG